MKAINWNLKISHLISEDKLQQNIPTPFYQTMNKNQLIKVEEMGRVQECKFFV